MVYVQLLLVVSFASLCLSCDVIAKVLAEPPLTKPQWFQFTFHNGTSTELTEFPAGKNDEKVEFHITGLLCNLLPTSFRAFSTNATNSVLCLDSGPDKECLGESKAFIEGMGVISYYLTYNSVPHVGGRVGVSCGFGDCGRG